MSKFRAFTVPVVRVDRVHLRVTVKARNQREATRKVECMRRDLLEDKAHSLDVEDDPDYVVGDAAEGSR